jgi:hypothetical protein
MGKFKVRYLFVKSNGSVQEVSYEKFCKLRITHLKYPRLKHRLVGLGAKWIVFFYGECFFKLPRKVLEEILKEV